MVTPGLARAPADSATLPPKLMYLVLRLAFSVKSRAARWVRIEADEQVAEITQGVIPDHRFAPSSSRCPTSTFSSSRDHPLTSIPNRGKARSSKAGSKPTNSRHFGQITHRWTGGQQRPLDFVRLLSQGRLRVELVPHPVPPSSDRLHRELRRIVGDPHIHPSRSTWPPKRRKTSVSPARPKAPSGSIPRPIPERSGARGRRGPGGRGACRAGPSASAGPGPLRESGQDAANCSRIARKMRSTSSEVRGSVRGRRARRPCGGPRGGVGHPGQDVQADPDQEPRAARRLDPLGEDAAELPAAGLDVVGPADARRLGGRSAGAIASMTATAVASASRGSCSGRRPCAAGSSARVNVRLPSSDHQACAPRPRPARLSRRPRPPAAARPRPRRPAAGPGRWSIRRPRAGSASGRRARWSWSVG